MTSELLFGEWVKLRRTFLGLTQAELGRRAGCAAITIRKIEAGDLHPSLEVAAQLAEHLNLMGQTRTLFIQVARGEHGSGMLPPPTQTNVSAAPRAIQTPSNLPAPTTGLIGREQDLAAGRELLRSQDVRLVTLTGPGGVGKTRLGLQIASDLRAEFADGAFFVDLAPIDASLVTPAIAQSVGVREESERSLLESLMDYLRPKESLLLLDNFEHVVSAAPDIATLLAVAPRLTLLVTSREALQIYGEQEFPLPPLALPDLHYLLPANVLARNAAVALFLALYGLGVVAQIAGEYAVSNAHCEESLAVQRGVGDRWPACLTLIILGEVARAQGDDVRAGTFYEQSLALSQELGIKDIAAVCLHNLGWMALHQGERKRAAVLVEESLTLSR